LERRFRRCGSTFGLKRRNPYMGGSGLASAVMTVFRCPWTLGGNAQR